MEEKKKHGGPGRGQGRHTNESKGKPNKVMYPKRVLPEHIPLIDEFIKTLT